MMDQPRRGVASHQSPAERLDGKVALQAVTRGPADDPSREEVEHDGEVEPALRRPDVGDIGPPLLVRAVRREVLRHEIGRLRGSESDPGDRFPERRPGMFTVGRAFEAPLLPRDQPVLAHQPRRAMPHDLMALVDELAVHARAAIGAVRQGEGGADMREIDHVLLLAATGRTVLPREEAALADTQGTAHPTDREAGLLRRDEARRVIDLSLSRRRRRHCRSDQWRDNGDLFLRCRAPGRQRQ